MDNNNYYTRRSFANAVLRQGVVGDWGGCGDRGGGKMSVNEVGVGNGRPFYLARLQEGEGGREGDRRDEKGEEKGVILKRDRYASLRSLPSSMYSLYDCLLLLLLPFSFSYFLLFSHFPSLLLYTWPLVLPLRSAALPLYHYPSFPLFVVQWTRAYSAVDDSVNSYRKGVYTYSYV